MSGLHPVAVGLEALYRRAQAAAAGRQDLRVDFGPTGPFSERVALAIALSPYAIDPATAEIGGGAGSDEHDVDVPCAALAQGGSSDAAGQIERMYLVHAAVDLLRDAMAADPTLGTRCVSSARIVREQYEPLTDEKRRPLAQVTFTVRVAAYRTT